jgi:hypothetical protein
VNSKPDAALLRSLKTVGVAGSRPWKKPKPPAETTLTENFLYAIRQTILMLADGQWHPRGAIIALCENLPGVGIEGVVDAIGAAESDHGKWFCLPMDHTPVTAPDE